MISHFGKAARSWQQTKLRHCVESVQNGIWGGEPGTSDKDVVCVRVADFQWRKLEVTLDNPTIRAITEQQFEKLALKPGDLLLEKSGGGEKSPVGRTVRFTSPQQAVCSNFVARIRPASQVYPEYLAYLFAALYLSGWSHQFIKQNTGIQNLDSRNLLDTWLHVPPPASQRDIAAFLDRETARIDQLIAKKEQMVATLGEKIVNSTERFVTIGLHSDVSKKSARSAFLSPLPANWNEERMRFAIKNIEQGWSPQCEEREAIGDEWGVLKLSSITSGKYLEERHKALPQDLEPRAHLQVRQGDVLIARASGSPALVGRACFVSSSTRRLMISDKHYRVKLWAEKYDPEFYVLALNAPVSRGQIENRLSSAEGMARNIGQDVIRDIWWAVPPLAEQRVIVTHVANQRHHIEQITARLNASIDRLREYRSALITAAVTGQIDVTTWRRRGYTERQLEAIARDEDAVHPGSDPDA